MRTVERIMMQLRQEHKKVSKFVKVAITVALAGVALAALVGCGGAKSVQIAVPSDPTNEARALLLLQEPGMITLKDGVGSSATKDDIASNPHHIEIVETEAAALPSTLQEVDFAVINGTYAIEAGLDIASALAQEDAGSDATAQYANVVAVREGEEDSNKIKALVTALRGYQVRTYITDTYNGAVTALTDGFRGFEIEDAEEGDEVIVVGASSVPHADILAQAKTTLANHGYTLEVVEYSDYTQPNVALSKGELDANYFQHLAYLEDYNAKNSTNLVSAGSIHFEPMGLYPGKTKTLDGLSN